MSIHWLPVKSVDSSRTLREYPDSRSLTPNFLFMPRYTPATVEPKWQRYWDEHNTFKTPDMPTAEKLYVLDMFP